MALRIVTPAAGLPMSVLEARAHVRQTETVDDAALERAIRACERFAQTECQRTLLGTRYRLTLDCLPWRIDLPHGPVRQVVSVRYKDTTGSWQTLDASLYVLDLDDQPARITQASGAAWPPTLSVAAGVVAEVVYDAGDAAPVTADATANTITVRGPWPALAVNDVVRLTNSGGALPAPLAADTDYYVQAVVSAGVYRLAATAGGSQIDITDAGTGSHYIGEPRHEVLSWMLLRLGSLYANREAEADAQLAALPYIDRMLDPARIEVA